MSNIGSEIAGAVSRRSRAKRPAGSAKPTKGPVSIGGGSIVKSSPSSKDKPKPAGKTR